MNKNYKILIAIGLISIAFPILSQTGKKIAPPVIEIDFMKLDSIPKFSFVEHGKKYKIKIKNFNQSLYKVEGTVVGKDFNTVMPEIFKGVKLPGYLNLELPKTPEIVNTKEVHLNSKDKEIQDETTKNIAIIQHSIEKINKCAALNNEFINLFKDCENPYNTIEIKLIKVVNDYMVSDHNNRKLQEEALRNNLSSILQEAFLAKQDLDSLVPLNLAILNSQKKTQDSIIRVWERNPESKKPIPNQILLMKADDAKNKSEELKNYSDSLKAVVAKCGEYITSLEKFRDENKVQGLINNYNMINETNFTYYTDEIKAKKDEVSFDIKIHSENQLPCNKQTKISFSETYETIGGWKVDFSTGAFANFGNRDFIGRNLYYKKVTDSTVTIQDKDGGKRAIIGVGALIHVYYRCKGPVNVGFSAGLSTSTAFDALNFHAGASLLFGKENRFVLTYGITLREANILDKQYEYNTEYNKTDLPETPSSIKVFPLAGSFLSLTYNWVK